MIRPDDDPRGAYGRRASFGERLAGAAGTAGIVAAIGAALLFGLNGGTIIHDETATRLIAVPTAPPPSPKRPIPIERPRRKAARAAPAPPNLRSKATDVVAPPVLRPAPPPPLVVAPRPATGAMASSGASDRAGPGTGAGGRGDGTGGGGDGGEGAGDRPPRQTRGRLRFADMPEALRAAGVTGRVGVAYQVRADGGVGFCRIAHSSGTPELDALTCQLIRQRFRFAPARDQDGRAVDSIVEEDHVWEIDRSDYDR